MCPNPSVSKKESNEILKYQSDDLSRRIAFWTSSSNPHLRGIIFPYFFHVPKIRYIHKFPSLTDKDNRKVTIKRKQKWSKFISTPQSRFAFDDPNEDTTNIETDPPKTPNANVISITDRRVCPSPLPPATMRLDWPEASGKKRESSGKLDPLSQREARAAAPGRKRRLSGILLMWDKQTSMAARSRQHIGPGLINRDGAFLSARPRTD